MIIESDLERAEERAELSERWVSLPWLLLLALRCPWMWRLFWCPAATVLGCVPQWKGLCVSACLCLPLCA